MNFRTVQITLWVLVAVAGAYFLFKQGGEAPQQQPVQAAQNLAVEQPYLNLTGSDGAPVDTSRFADSHQLVYFGFTFCPDVCPISARKMVTADALYQLMPAEVPLETVFVSFDVARDTPPILAEYEVNLTESVAAEFSAEERAAMDLTLTALTGSQDEMDDALAQYPAFVTRIDDPDQPDGYTFSHTDIIYWVRPDGSVGLFSARHGPQAIADALAAWS